MPAKTPASPKALAKIAEREVRKDGGLAKIGGKDATVSRVAKAGNVSISRAAAAVYAAEFALNPNLRIPATPTAVAKARAKGLRVERIAVRAGISKARVDALYAAKTGEERRLTSYVGRGTKGNLSPDVVAKRASVGR